MHACVSSRGAQSTELVSLYIGYWTLNNYYLLLLVHSLVTSRLDYSNALLCGAQDDVVKQVERVERIAERVMCKKYTNDHSSVTELLWGLHWLPIKARIQYKILLLVYKALNTGTPPYLQPCLHKSRVSW